MNAPFNPTPRRVDYFRIAEVEATRHAAIMARRLERLTPADLGFPHMSAEELIALEFADWFAETLRTLAGRPTLVLAPAISSSQ